MKKRVVTYTYSLPRCSRYGNRKQETVFVNFVEIYVCSIGDPLSEKVTKSTDAQDSQSEIFLQPDFEIMMQPKNELKMCEYRIS